MLRWVVSGWVGMVAVEWFGLSGTDVLAKVRRENGLYICVGTNRAFHTLQEAKMNSRAVAKRVVANYG